MQLRARAGQDDFFADKRTQQAVIMSLIIIGEAAAKIADIKLESAKKLLGSGVPPKGVTKNFGVSIPTLYGWMPATAHA